MAFLDKYYNLKVEISDSARQVYYRSLTRFALYEQEPPYVFATKILAFIHAYVAGLSSVKEESDDRVYFAAQDLLGAYTSRISVGLPDAGALRTAIKQNNACRFAVYFTDGSEPLEFAKKLKGSKTNWIDGVDFYAFPEFLVGEFEKRLQTSSKLSLTVVDDQLYFEIDGESFSGEIQRLDMWDVHQKHLNAQAGAVE